jgi:orotidine-5'-phosphate decarboxylase
MNASTLFQEILRKKSYLCVGLDTDLTKIPPHLLSEKDPIFEFNRQIIDATADFCVAYKPNIAFYECLGSKGWDSLARTAEYLPQDTFKIADAKRGDIGNTSTMYAKAFFEQMNFDAITLSPYMGKDSISPFLAFPDKWAILLALTSNEGSKDFQNLRLHNGKQVFEEVLNTSQQWGSTDNLMYVVGATKAAALAEIRQLIPQHFLLVPGYGSQGGELAAVAKYGLNKQCGLLINSSRAIIYADNTKDFAKTARKIAQSIAQEMQELGLSI